jgi:hypothetical protein
MTDTVYVGEDELSPLRRLEESTFASLVQRHVAMGVYTSISEQVDRDTRGERRETLITVDHEYQSGGARR